MQRHGRQLLLSASAPCRVPRARDMRPRSTAPHSKTPCFGRNASSPTKPVSSTSTKVTSSRPNTCGANTNTSVSSKFHPDLEEPLSLLAKATLPNEPLSTTARAASPERAAEHDTQGDLAQRAAATRGHAQWCVRNYAGTSRTTAFSATRTSCAESNGRPRSAPGATKSSTPNSRAAPRPLMCCNSRFTVSCWGRRSNSSRARCTSCSATTNRSRSPAPNTLATSAACWRASAHR